MMAQKRVARIVMARTMVDTGRPVKRKPRAIMEFAGQSFSNS
jgi:hypothetical protein